MRRLTLIVLALALAACGGPALRANAGADFTVPVGDNPTFDGCASTGNIVNYKWTVLHAPEGEMAGDTGKVIREVDANCSFVLDESMAYEHMGMWEVELEVRDGSGATSTDTVMVTIQ